LSGRVLRKTRLFLRVPKRIVPHGSGDRGKSMMPKSGYHFLENIMLQIFEKRRI
jgi:hypothetical protein